MDNKQTFLLKQATTFRFGLSYEDYPQYYRDLAFSIEWRGHGYGVYWNGSVLSKIDLQFEHETMPSNRDDKFFQEYRFPTIEEAYAYGLKAFRLMFDVNSNMALFPDDVLLAFFKILNQGAEELGVAPIIDVSAEFIGNLRKKELERRKAIELKRANSTTPTGAESLCSICNEHQFITPSGPCCKNGHGGAPAAKREGENS